MVGGSNYQEKNYLLLSKTSGGGGGVNGLMQVQLTYIHVFVLMETQRGDKQKQKMVYTFPLMIVLPILCDFYRGLRAKLLLPFSAQWLFATCSICAFGQQ